MKRAPANGTFAESPLFLTLLFINYDHRCRIRWETTRGEEKKEKRGEKGRKRDVFDETESPAGDKKRKEDKEKTRTASRIIKRKGEK